jgi:hypothetical protein
MGCSVAVFVCFLCVERVWVNATGAMSAPQARITIVFLIMIASFIVAHGYAR